MTDQYLAPRQHILDHPVRAALSSRQAHFAKRVGSAVMLHEPFGPFAAAGGASDTAQSDVAELVNSRGSAVLTLQAQPCAPPEGVVRRGNTTGLQMVASRPLTPSGAHRIEILNAGDAPQIYALAQRTKPGPFSTKTHQLGLFLGIKREGRLVAMAGQRFRPPGFTEISAVCVDPAEQGRGLGSELIQAMAHRICAAGETPFLHTYESNLRAIALYQKLGFEIRARMFVAELHPMRPEAPVAFRGLEPADPVRPGVS